MTGFSLHFLQRSPSEEVNTKSPLLDVPAKALNRSEARTPGRASRKGEKLWENGELPERKTLLRRVPRTWCKPRLGFIQSFPSRLSA
jgi:hypothetical protein